jgi:hypothetical protein
VREQGWYADPYGLHGDRWYSGGTPTSLVRDGGVESHDTPPPAEPRAAPVPLELPPGDASDMKRADEVPASLFDADLSCAAQERVRKPWLATWSVRRGLVAAGALIASFFLSGASFRIEAVIWLVSGAWFAASAVVVRSRQRGARHSARWRH